MAGGAEEALFARQSCRRLLLGNLSALVVHFALMSIGELLLATLSLRQSGMMVSKFPTGPVKKVLFRGISATTALARHRLALWFTTAP